MTIIVNSIVVLEYNIPKEYHDSHTRCYSKSH